ncbi:peptidase S9, prolyl oligopeptidase active site domain protein [Indibacter alkaliphilus LW1]|uniref:Peptidase S9, prolyl oligopeptidase active site domain protein n=1 Tax=Indibacter alkaliphilus (strain CCUG 57479 / KCTC 22604 / LW1) TaxID=1189612 RepID=S2D3K9_INDAL|nr:PD40 domain-containing protein [Indibacter alkaliphilus]EOZ93474.1 peptidase S9, prolyl oligopeptidase active site domain protein [Indibacter alkaliphilus LW1]
MKKLIILSSFLFFLSSLYAQSIEDYLSVPFPTSLTANPSGTAVAWVFNEKGERNVFYAESPEYNTIKLTDYKGDIGVEIDQLNFSPDGKYLLFVRGNAPNSKGEPANPAQLQEDLGRVIHFVELAEGEIHEVAKGSSPLFHPKENKFIFIHSGKVYYSGLEKDEKPSELFYARGSQGQFVWRPDGKMLAFSSNRGDHAFLGLLDLETKELSYPDPGMDHDGYPAWNADGTQLAYLRVPNINNQLPFTSLKETYPWTIRVLDLETMKAQEVFKASKGPGSVMVRDLPAVNKRLWWTPSNALVFPDEVHSFLLHRNWVAAYQATFNFFQEQLKKKRN